MPDVVETAGGPLSAEEQRVLLTEIAAELSVRRESGALSATEEREMAGAFAAHAPIGSPDDPVQLLRRAGAAAFVDPAAPTESRIPGAQPAKVLLRRGIGWCLGWLAGQLTSYNAIANRLLHMHDDRVAKLEGVAGTPDPAIVHRVAGRPDERLVLAHDVIVSELAGLADGRVLVVRGGAGRLCSTLVAAGLDAYLVDPNPEATFEAAAAGLDARPGTAVEHLLGLPAASLAGVVLIGDPDEAPPTAKVSLVSATLSALRPGGVVVVAGTDPKVWGTGATVAASDLALGSPWKAKTWLSVLREIGFDAAAAPAPAPAGTVVVVGRAPSIRT